MPDAVNRSEAAGASNRNGANDSKDGNGLSDIESEEHVVCCIILDPERVIPMVASVLSSADFMVPKFGSAFEACVNLHRAGVSLFDPTVAIRELESAGIQNPHGIYAASLKIPNVSSVIYHADRVRNLSRLRTINASLAALRDDVFTPKASADEVLGTLESRLLRLRSGGAISVKEFSAVCDEVIEDMQARVGKPDPAVLLSGLPGADRAGFVFGNGELTILAARPGVGKTSLATQIAMHHAGKGRSVLMASLEMRDRELVSRVLISSAGHNHQFIRTNRVYQECVDDLRAASNTIGRPPLFVWSPGRVKAGMIHATASLLKASKDLRLLIVDYLGYVRPDDPRAQRYEQVGEVVKSLRDIGQHLQIPVICLAQLNRRADGAEPKLSDLRESGDIEQDADVVAFLHAPDANDKTRVDLIVAKDRQGAVGQATLLWRPEQTRFEDQSGGTEWERPRFDADEFNQREF